MFKVQLDEKILQQAVKLAVCTEVIPNKEYPGRGPILRDYLDFISGADAAELDILLTYKDDEENPIRSINTFIREDEQEDIEIAILTPLIKAAIEYYLTKIMER